MTLRVGLIGSGYMGRAHALAYRSAAAVFDLPVEPELELLADVDGAAAADAARSLGFARSTGDWRELAADPRVDVVDITTPNLLHAEMALAAIEAGKHVYCEKPLAPTAAAAKPMVDAAEAAGVRTMVGFNYLKNPITQLAREIIDSGEIGEVFGFRGNHFEDYMLDPNTLVSPWRFDPRSGDGAVADLGSHILSMARYLIGPIESVSADRQTVIGERIGLHGRPMKIEVADQMSALLRFAGGATGTAEASWIATGRKMAIGCEVRGTKGALAFDFERLNELQLYTTDRVVGREGFTTILAGPAHPDFASFVPAPGHQLGFNDQKTIEVRDLVEGIAASAGSGPWPDFREAWEVQRVVDAILASDRAGHWVKVEEYRVTVECVLDAGAALGECPVWDGRAGVLFWIDIDGRTVHRYDPATGNDETRVLAGRPGSLALTADPDRLLVAVEHQLLDLTWSSGATVVRADLEPEGPGKRLNDGRCDPAGRFWVGSMGDPPTDGRNAGMLHRVELDGTAEVVRTGIGVSNALAFSPDGTTMYWADTFRDTVWAYDYDIATGVRSNERVFLDFADLPGRPDGACVDSSGCFWVACVYGWALLRATPGGEVDRIVELPVEKPTMPAFGGPRLDTLFLTSISSGGSYESAPGQPLAGALFALDPGVTGLPEPRFGPPTTRFV